MGENSSTEDSGAPKDDLTRKRRITCSSNTDKFITVFPHDVVFDFGVTLEVKEFFTTPFTFSGITFPNTMLHSVKGLICFIDLGSRLLYICNPTARESRQLPNLSHKHRNGKIGYGFGYSHPSSSSPEDLVYKVVIVLSSGCLCCDSKNPVVNNCLIHTLGSDSWRKIESPKYPLLDDSVFVDGVMYWIIRSKVDGLVIIVSFDVGGEVFGEVSPPIEISSAPNQGEKFVQLVNFNGSLCLVDWILADDEDSPGSVKELNVWKMLKQESDTMKNTGFESRWVLEHHCEILDLFSIDQRGILDIPYCEMSLTMQILQIQNGKILFRCAFNGLYSYDMDIQGFEKVSGDSLSNTYVQSTFYEHSLVPLFKAGRILIISKDPIYQAEAPIETLRAKKFDLDDEAREGDKEKLGMEGMLFLGIIFPCFMFGSTRNRNKIPVTFLFQCLVHAGIGI
ncbi:F-box associated domain [Macleaya cordata]|uniref:F-box associated domain n=1 Tax=Macleaya cordata TaxID=56857 RepID=A0A200QWW7_MACCD|nr:F-box associated domain [Macleaya cordata]